MRLIIIRGPSGSGKSTIATKGFKALPELTWFEADMFFYQKPDGQYVFDPQKLGQAHSWCQRQIREAIQIYAKTNHPVVVSNTSTTIRELNDYIKIAQEEGVAHEVVRTPGPWNIDELFKRNSHNVPRAVLEKQIARYVAAPNETEWNDLSIFNGVK